MTIGEVQPASKRLSPREKSTSAITHLPRAGWDQRIGKRMMVGAAGHLAFIRCGPLAWWL